ncbi:hypothetical protein IC582_008634 [Cucumis melo]
MSRCGWSGRRESMRERSRRRFGRKAGTAAGRVQRATAAAETEET